MGCCTIKQGLRIYNRALIENIIDAHKERIAATGSPVIAKKKKE